MKQTCSQGGLTVDRGGKHLTTVEVKGLSKMVIYMVKLDICGALDAQKKKVLKGSIKHPRYSYISYVVISYHIVLRS